MRCIAGLFWCSPCSGLQHEVQILLRFWKVRDQDSRERAQVCEPPVQGRVACEINSGDELVATEMIFAGVLSELEPEEAVALLSALVFQVSGL